VTPQLVDDLKRDEGLRLDAYRDTRGVWTIGYGHAGVAPGTTWTLDEADAQLAVDIAATAAELDERLPWWRGLDDVRQDVLCEMAFNLGVEGLLGFTGALRRIRAGDYAMASAQMLLSAWAGQVGARARRLAAMMKTGARAPGGASPETSRLKSQP
jgi:lysozyme